MIEMVEIGSNSYISAAALGKKFGVHRTTIQRWAKERGLPCIKIGQTRMFAMDKLDAWLQHQAG